MGVISATMNNPIRLWSYSYRLTVAPSSMLLSPNDNLQKSEWTGSRASEAGG